MADTQVLDWNNMDEDTFQENFSKEDIDDAESMGKPPVGKYLVKVVDSTPRQIDFHSYSCIAVVLKMQIERVLELSKKPVVGSEGDLYVGRFIYDEVPMYSPKEKDGWRKRRILIAKRAGLISKDGEKITKDHWQNQIIGKRFVVELEDQEYQDKNNQKKVIRKVPFNGYDYAEAAEVVSEAEIDDI